MYAQRKNQWDLPPAQKFLDDVKFRAEGALEVFLSIREQSRSSLAQH